MSPKTLADALKRITQLESDIKGLKEKVSLGKTLDLGQGAGEFLSMAGILQKRTAELEKSLENLSQAGATFAKGGGVTTALQTAIKNLDLFITRGDVGAEAVKNLQAGFEQFGNLAELAGQKSKGLAGNLATQAALLNQLGLSYGAFNKNLDLAIFSFGQNATQVQGLNLEMQKFAQSVNMLPETVSRNFQTVAKNLAYDFNTIKQQFVGIQKLSAQTGVSVDSLLGKFGKPMDTISGASEMAARMNALLGRNAFSASQLLMMNEEDRMNMFRDVVGRDQNVGAALSSDNQVERKFALQSVAAAMQMDEDTARRFLQGGSSDSVKQQMTDQSSVGFSKENFKVPAGNLEKALRTLTRTIRRDQMNLEERVITEGRESVLNRFGSGKDALFETAAATATGVEFGTLPGGLDAATFNKARNNFPIVGEVIGMAQMDILSEKDKRSAIKAVEKLANNPDDESAQNVLNQIRKNASTLGSSKSEISALELNMISKATDSFGLQRRAIKFALSNDLKVGQGETEGGVISRALEGLRGSTKRTPLTAFRSTGPRQGPSRAQTDAASVTNIKVIIGGEEIDNKFVKVFMETIRKVFE
jgi:hypothetical protein